MSGTLWVQTCVREWGPVEVLDYLTDALAEDDPACFAYALAVVAAARGVACVAMLPLPPKENGPSGPFVGLPGLFA